MSMQVIKPGILVAVRTSVGGGVSYQREDLEPEVQASEQAPARKVEKWKTTKIVTDAEEHERASKTRSTALSLIRRECIETSFGLLAVGSKEAELDAAIAEARRLAREFNDRSRYSKISISVLKGRVASTDEEAVRAVSAELGDLMREMDASIRRLDPAAIRAAAQKASKIQQVLTEAQQLRVTAAVEAARKAAREIVRRVEKGGEDAAVVLRDIQTTAIDTARVSFLELEGGGGLAAEQMPEADLGRVAALEDVVVDVPQQGPQEPQQGPEPPTPAPEAQGEPQAPVQAQGDAPRETPRAPWWPAPPRGEQEVASAAQNQQREGEGGGSLEAPPLATPSELLEEVSPTPPAPPPPPTAPAPIQVLAPLVPSENLIPELEF